MIIVLAMRFLEYSMRSPTVNCSSLHGPAYHNTRIHEERRLILYSFVRSFSYQPGRLEAAQHIFSRKDSRVDRCSKYWPIKLLQHLCNSSLVQIRLNRNRDFFVVVRPTTQTSIAGDPQIPRSKPFPRPLGIG